ncbi:MAG: DEAD/DEAH box helicase family protein, partial [Firmicutes bacterium]|nr:DEAD/DEAH box helicase family protein [Bacillota bacterium]
MYAKVLLRQSGSKDRIFDYSVPAEMASDGLLGMRVAVPLGRGNHVREGFVIALSEESSVESEKLKPILRCADKSAVFSPELLKTAEWMAKKYQTTLASALRLILPGGISLKSPGAAVEKRVKYFRLTNNTAALSDFLLRTENNKRYKTAHELLSRLSQKELPSSEISQKSTLATLTKYGLVESFYKEVLRDAISLQLSDASAAKTLTFEQEKALGEIFEELENPIKRPVLIHGITGSGKTELYLRTIEKILGKGRSAIVLVPEIALTPMMTRRFFERFGNLVTVTHSRLSPGERFDQWKKAARGEIKVMIGPRSAVFTPFSDLGAIIIDEEHETYYQAEDGVRYDAREVAAFRCENAGALLLSGSATPSLESYFKA